MSIKCLMNGTEVNYPCSPACALFGDCVTAFESQKKVNVRTNADRIRAMSDEELATFISEIADECERNTECNQHCYGCDIEYCVRESCLKWLQQLAEEDDYEQ